MAKGLNFHHDGTADIMEWDGSLKVENHVNLGDNDYGFKIYNNTARTTNYSDLVNFTEDNASTTQKVWLTSTGFFSRTGTHLSVPRLNRE